MKNKKLVLIILLILIVIIAIFLGIVLIYGGKKEQKINDYYNTIEESACKFAHDENYTETICEGFENICKIKYKTLINREYLKGDLVNPLTEESVSKDTRSYVEISWQDGKMICKHKEG